MDCRHIASATNLGGTDMAESARPGTKHWNMPTGRAGGYDSKSQVHRLHAKQRLGVLRRLRERHGLDRRDCRLIQKVIRLLGTATTDRLLLGGRLPLRRHPATDVERLIRSG